MLLGDNSSGHSPIMLNLRVSDIPRRPTEEEVRVPRRLAWQKADPGQLRDYKVTLERRLEELKDPESLLCDNPRCKQQHHSDERDHHVLDVIAAWIEASYSTIPIVPPPRPEETGKHGKKRLELPGWRETCEPLE